MPRKLRIQYPGAIYHVMSRGDQRENIFKDDKDRKRFIHTLASVGSGSGYLRTVCDYVHLNPVRAGLIEPEAELEFQAGAAATQKHPRRGTAGADRQLQLCILPS